MGGYSPKSEDFDKHYEKHDYYGSSSYRTSYGTEKRARRVVHNPDQVFKSSYMPEEFDPSKIKLPREACDSAMSPHSRPFIFAEDVTGSMGYFLLSLIQQVHPRMVKELVDRYDFDPHIMFMGIGDVAAGDRAPLQVTQFEADLRMLDQLVKIWLEKHGGSNAYESYILAWYFAGKYCKIDSYEKRGEKGFCFTFGDEEPTPYLSASELTEVFGNRDDLDKRSVSDKDCLDMASEKFYCYHIILHGNAYSYYSEEIIYKWRKLLGGHACDLSDYECLPELVFAIVDMYEGLSKTEAIGKIKDAHTRQVVANALSEHEEYVEVSKAKAKSNTTIDVF